jgi:hypothetical protein
MDKTADQIENEIDRTREALMSNLQELETRVKSAADWRGYVEKHPGKMVVAALVSGALLSMIGKR